MRHIESISHRRLALVAAIALTAVPRAVAAPPIDAERVEFNRDVRNILSDKCFTCHGPDESERVGGVRLDLENEAKADLGGRFAIVPGDPEASAVYRRITHEDAALRMPPAYASKSITPRETELIRRWIEQGAEYQGHWSFIAPKRPAPPEVSEPTWPRNPIDSFVLARLDREGLKPSPPAAKQTLIRRATLDVTGLPPTPAEVDAFLADDSPGAYEALLDRLLESPRYGERMAVRWLDAARYADTNGYQTDGEREMWRWRDWVIDAFNSNMPFDQFTIEQLAGDLLPNPTVSQNVATGFNRNHRANSEGGIVPEEYLVEYFVDRVETTSTVWLGLTLGCARCHDHKYDPFSQTEFYRLASYFNNIPERGRVFKFGNTPPLIAAPTAADEARLAAVEERLRAAEKRFAALEPEIDKALEAWRPWNEPWRSSRDEVFRMTFDNAGAAGRVGGAKAFDGSGGVEAGDEPDFGYRDPFTISAWVFAEDPNGAIVAKTDRSPDDQGYGFGGWGLYLIDGKLKLYLLQRYLDDGMRVASREELPLGEWHHVAVSYDGSRLASGMKFYIDGEERPFDVELDFVNQEIRRKAPVLIGDGGGLKKGFEGRLDELLLYERALPRERIEVLAAPESLVEIATIEPEQRSPAQARKLREAFLDQYGPADIRAAWAELTALRRGKQDVIDSFPTVMVMRELDEPRDTFRLDRGAYDAPAEKVSRGTPAALPPLPAGVPNNRLGLARWLVSDDHPLTARVTVNRLWAMFFGRGLVKTVQDFGSQGEWPSHPELLDWLAREFVESDWDVKRLVKTILASATYRQSSRVDAESVGRDPENMLLARGPRVRLPAEILRDQALAVAGLLVERTGGPSVKPYQPAGLWEELAGQTYDQDHGEKLYRRSLYTFWKRTAPPPFMTNFDSAGREVCTVTHTRTNTPLQALNLMNDPTYVEAARALAERMLSEGGSTPVERLDHGFRLATARKPAAAEREVLLDSLGSYLDRYREDPEAARRLLATGEHPRDEALDAAEHAAYAAAAALMLNLDETITKE